MKKKLFKVTIHTFLMFASLMAVSTANADILVNASLNGLSSNQEEGNAINAVFTVEVGDEQNLVAMAWDFRYLSFAPSFLSEAGFAIGDTYGAGSSVILFPGLGDDFTGTQIYSSGGLVSLFDMGFGVVGLTDSNGDGSNDFYVELFESNINLPGAPEGIYADAGLGTNPSGQFGLDFFAVPEPGSLILLSALSAAAAIRRRRS